MLSRVGGFFHSPTVNFRQFTNTVLLDDGESVKTPPSEVGALYNLP